MELSVEAAALVMRAASVLAEGAAHPEPRSHRTPSVVWGANRAPMPCW